MSRQYKRLVFKGPSTLATMSKQYCCFYGQLCSIRLWRILQSCLQKRQCCFDIVANLLLVRSRIHTSRQRKTCKINNNCCKSKKSHKCERDARRGLVGCTRGLVSVGFCHDVMMQKWSWISMNVRHGRHSTNASTLTSSIASCCSIVWLCCQKQQQANA